MKLNYIFRRCNIHALFSRITPSYMYVLIVFILHLLITSGNVDAGEINTNIVTDGNTAQVSWSLPTWQNTSNYSGWNMLYFTIKKSSSDNGLWLPNDVVANLSCSLTLNSDEWDQPQYITFSAVDDSGARAYFPETTVAPSITGECFGVIINNRNESIYLENKTVANIGVKTSSNVSNVGFELNVTGELGALVTCSVSTPNSVVNFTGTPEDYVNGITENIDLNIACAGAGAGAGATLYSASSGEQNGDCIDIENTSSDKSGGLTFCLTYNDSPLNLNYSNSAVIPLDNGNADITLQAQMKADSISSVSPGEYSTTLFLIVSPL